MGQPQGMALRMARKNFFVTNAGFARNPTKASTPARKLARDGEGHREKHFSSHFFSAPLRLEAYGICRAVSAVLRLSIFLFFMADFLE